MNRKNFFKNLTVGVAATFWGSKLKALEEIPIPEGEPAFKYEMPEEVIIPMEAYRVGDMFLHAKTFETVDGFLIGKYYRVMSETHCREVSDSPRRNFKDIRLDSFNPKEIKKLYSQIQY